MDFIVVMVKYGLKLRALDTYSPFQIQLKTLDIITNKTTYASNLSIPLDAEMVQHYILQNNRKPNYDVMNKLKNIQKDIETVKSSGGLDDNKIDKFITMLDNIETFNSPNSFTGNNNINDIETFNVLGYNE